MFTNILILMFLFISFTMLLGTEYNVDKSKKNLVKFISEAPIENFEGVSNNIDGYLFFNGEYFTNGSSLYFEVDLRTIDTGIGLRNRHMHENYLETDKFPIASFKGEISALEKTEENIYKVRVTGEMSIHGLTKKHEIEGTIKKDNNNIEIITKFDVNLNDHKIEVPKLMFFKINEIMDLRLNFFMKKVLDN